MMERSRENTDWGIAKMERNNDFAVRMKEVTKEKHMFLNHVGKTIGASPTAMNSYATGKTMPSLDKAIEIAKLLDVSLDYLCGLSDDKRPLSAREISRKDVIRILGKLSVNGDAPCITAISGEDDGSMSLRIKGLLSQEEIKNLSDLHDGYKTGALPLSLYQLLLDRIAKQEATT